MSIPCQDVQVLFVTQKSILFSNYTVLGDFNLHVDDPSCVQAWQLVSSLAGANLTQYVGAPTHNAGHTLDLVFSNIQALKMDVPRQLAWTDHCLIPLFFRLGKPILHVSSHSFLKRNWKNLTEESLRPVLQSSLPGLSKDPNTDALALDKWIAAAV